MQERSAICIVIDGLRAGALGTYGNTTSSTPCLDKLASRSSVAEWLWADSPRRDAFYRAAWQGAHALRPGPIANSPSLLELFGQADIERRLITDDADLAEQPDHDRFDKVVCIETSAEGPADDISETVLGQFCSGVIERLDAWHDAGAVGLTWLHTCGLFGPWDAPLELRAEQWDEEDPPPAEFLYPPAALHNVEDPDALLAHRSAYAAQAAVVDACVGALWQAIEELAAGTETLLMLLGSRGFALGEHGNLGGECRELFGERLHLPWLVHECGQKIPRPRLAGLAQPADVGATLWQWFGAGDREDASDGRGVLGGSGLRQFVVSVGDGEERAIRTPAWFLRRTSADAAPQLFAKPDDRWEANDVAVRCPQVVERLQVVLAEFEQCCRDGRPLPDGPLDDELINPAR